MKNFKRRSFITKAVAGIAAFSVIPAVGVLAGAKYKKKKTRDPYKHIVFFWLKNPTDEAVRQKFEQELKTLTENIDVIVCTHIGTPAPTNREVIDSSYTYNLLLTFKNKEDQDIYQDHPVHHKFIENASSLWEKVVVYDSVAV